MTIEEIARVSENAERWIKQGGLHDRDSVGMLVGVLLLLTEISIDLKKLLNSTVQSTS